MNYHISPRHKTLRILTIISMIARLLLTTTVVYADSLAFSEWGSEIADLSQYQTLDNALVDSGQISALDDSQSFSAVYSVDISTISDAVAALKPGWNMNLIAPYPMRKMKRTTVRK